MWIVELLKQPERFIYRIDYFPRKFKYKLDALALKKEVEKAGGKARVKEEK